MSSLICLSVTCINGSLNCHWFVPELEREDVDIENVFYDFHLSRVEHCNTAYTIRVLVKQISKCQHFETENRF